MTSHPQAGATTTNDALDLYTVLAETVAAVKAAASVAHLINFCPPGTTPWGFRDARKAMQGFLHQGVLYAPAIFRTRKAARESYEDVRRIEIREAKP
jgi:hypothetical protein